MLRARARPPLSAAAMAAGADSGPPLGPRDIRVCAPDALSVLQGGLRVFAPEAAAPRGDEVVLRVFAPEGAALFLSLICL